MRKTLSQCLCVVEVNDTFQPSSYERKDFIFQDLFVGTVWEERLDKIWKLKYFQYNEGKIILCSTLCEVYSMFNAIYSDYIVGRWLWLIKFER